jgi:PAS domain S-box-containing protein
MVDHSEGMDAWLSQRLDAMTEELVRNLRSRVKLYQDVPADQLQRSAALFIDRFVSALRARDLEPVIPLAMRNIEHRFEQGLSFEAGVQLTVSLRQTFLFVLRPAIEQRVEGVFDCLLFAELIFEELDTIAARFYWSKLEQATRALSESEERHRKLVELSPDGVAVLREGRFLYINPAGAVMLGRALPEELIGLEFASFLEVEQREAVTAELVIAERERKPFPRSEHAFMPKDGQSITVELLGTPIAFEGAEALQIVFRDITERKRAEQALALNTVQREHIRVQEQMLRELSTPLIPVSEDVVVMPLIGTLNEVRAEQMRGVLLEGIAAQRAKVAILDITGVPSVDEKVAEALHGAVRAGRLLGAEIILSGIKPAAAQAFVTIGADFGDVVTKSTLQAGIAYALKKA